jgi:hypothetical protein
MGMDKRLIYAMRIAVLVLLPFLVGALLLPHSQPMTGQELRAPNETASGGLNSVTYAFVHDSGSAQVSQRISSIFPLAEYLDFPPFVSHANPEICFEDSGSYVILPDNSTTVPDYQWHVLFNNATTLGVGPYSLNCTPIALGKEYAYSWKLQVNRIDSNVSGVATFVPKTDAYTRMTMDYGMLQGLAMIPVAFLLVWYPAAGIKKKILDGFEAQ